MDPQLLTTLAIAVGALFAGAALAGWAGRASTRSQVDAAVSRTQSESQAELSGMRVRVESAEGQRRESQAALEHLRQQADGWRTELDLARDDVAKLGERASRVATLENDVARHQRELADKGAELLRVTADNSRLLAEVTAERDSLAGARQEAAAHKLARETAEADVSRLGAELAELRTRLEAERKSGDDKLQVLVEARNALTEQFRNLANDILEEKTKRFSEQNQLALGQLLDPLRTQLHEFKGKVEEVYVQEGKDRSALAEQVRNLVSLNQALSQDAQNLTLALKGNSKAQGNWGELVLERVLEASGLRKGHEYEVQDNQQREDGTRAQPDVVIHLPEDRRLVVDSKVSLVAYEEHVLAQSDEEREVAIRRHLDSVRGHIKGLSGKNYQTLYGIKSLDFVLMFVPIEPAFMVAVTHDSNLFMDAWDKNVLLVSPSTLLFVVRTVAHLWRQEAQSRNAQEIARRGAELYDRLCDFVKDLDNVGARLKSAQESYESAYKRLSQGRGNVIRQAEMLKSLGVKPTKALQPALLDSALTEDDLEAAGALAALAHGNTPRPLVDPPAPAAAD
jgi:DNA recombination protein RmuC